MCLEVLFFTWLPSLIAWNAHWVIFAVGLKLHFAQSLQPENTLRAYTDLKTLRLSGCHTHDFGSSKKKKKQYFTLSLFPLLVVCKMPSKAQGRSNFPSLVLGFNWTVMARGTLLNKVGHSKCMPDTGEINREKITGERGKEGNGGGRYMVVTPTIWFSLFYTRVLKSETCLYVQILGCLFLHSVGLRNSCWT